jgi:hypothetical protein
VRQVIEDSCFVVDWKKETEAERERKRKKTDRREREERKTKETGYYSFSDNYL